MTSTKDEVSRNQRRRGRPPKGTRGDTRQDLLDAALRLFARQGYAATTVRQIADEVDVRDSAIYAHFNAKQELLDALVDESGRQLLDSLSFDFSRIVDHPFSEALTELIEEILVQWDRPRNRQLISLMTREGLVGVAEGLGHLRERLKEPFQELAGRGVLRKDVSPEFLLWEFTMPLAAVRILHLNAQASSAERREGRKLALEHLSYFVKTATA